MLPKYKGINVRKYSTVTPSFMYGKDVPHILAKFIHSLIHSLNHSIFINICTLNSARCQDIMMKNTDLIVSTRKKRREEMQTVKIDILYFSI